MTSSSGPRRRVSSGPRRRVSLGPLFRSYTSGPDGESLFTHPTASDGRASAPLQHLQVPARPPARLCTSPLTPSFPLLSFPPIIMCEALLRGCLGDGCEGVSAMASCGGLVPSASYPAARDAAIPVGSCRDCRGCRSKPNFDVPPPSSFSASAPNGLQPIHPPPLQLRSLLPF